MLEDALARFETQVQPIKCPVSLLQNIHDAQRLEVMLKPPVLAHAAVQRILTRMAKRRMPQIMRQRDCLDQILVQMEIAGNRPANLRDFKAVRQTRAEQITLVIDENLRFIFKAAKRGRMDDAIAIALKGRPSGRGVFSNAAPARIRLGDRIGRQITHLRCIPSVFQSALEQAHPILRSPCLSAPITRSGSFPPPLSCPTPSGAYIPLRQGPAPLSAARSVRKARGCA